MQEETDTLLDARVALLIMEQQPGQDQIPAYSKHIEAAWRVKERIHQLPFAGADEMLRAKAIARTFDDILSQTQITLLSESEAADFICHAALIAIQEGADYVQG